MDAIRYRTSILCESLMENLIEGTYDELKDHVSALLTQGYTVEFIRKQGKTYLHYFDPNTYSAEWLRQRDFVLYHTSRKRYDRYRYRYVMVRNLDEGTKFQSIGLTLDESGYTAAQVRSLFRVDSLLQQTIVR